MKQCLITFRSVTPAQRSEQLLRRSGVECTLQRTPRWMEQQGCGYSLALRQEDAQMAALILRKHSISYRKIYCRVENGAYEELAL